MLEIKGCIISIDAMGCQTAIADKFITQGADYVMAFKGNQGELSDEVKWLFQQKEHPKLKEQTVKETNSGHDQFEARRCRKIVNNKNG